MVGLRLQQSKLTAAAGAAAITRSTACSSYSQPNPGSIRRSTKRAAISGVPDTATDPPPYTLLSTPVYSLVTRSEDGLKANMNIVTYASPIAIQPQRKYALGLYIGTLSWENMHQTHKGVLQILQRQHSPLINLLGKQSGHDVDKVKEVEQLGFGLTDAFGMPVLEDCFGAMELQVASDFITCGKNGGDSDDCCYQCGGLTDTCRSNYA
eukprot:jgi/Chrzof1/13661/Cz08g07050.t1